MESYSLPQSKEFLVDSCETAILMQHEAFVQGALASLQDAIGKKNNSAEDDTALVHTQGYSGGMSKLPHDM